MIRVGTPWMGYAERRNFAGLEVPGVAYRRTVDPFAVLCYAAARLRLGRNERLRFLHASPGWPAVDLHHFFNTVSLGRTPWLVTFETALPKRLADGPRARRALVSDACRRLIGISEHARECLDHAWEGREPDLERLRAKLTVLHPPQQTLVAEDHLKPHPRDGLHFVFVGRAFFVKGGLPMLQAFDRLLARDAPVTLDVVSSLEAGDAHTRSGDAEVAEVRRLFDRWPDRLRWSSSLPNADVLDLLRRAHVLLLPTLADTYGYTVLEAQAAACATITTNVRALPEINDAATGWRVDLELKPSGSARLRGDGVLERVTGLLSAAIENAVEEILANPERVLARGRAAWSRIREQHSPERHAAALARLYGEALGQ